MVMTMVTSEQIAVKHIKASEFKAKCLKLMDEVQLTGEGIVVTKNGQPVARLMAMENQPKKHWYFGMGKGEFEIVGDIVKSPFDGWKVDPEPAKLAKPRKFEKRLSHAK